MTLAQKSDRILAQTRGLSGATPNATQLIEELRWALEENRREVERLTTERDEANRESERLREEAWKRRNDMKPTWVTSENHEAFVKLREQVAHAEEERRHAVAALSEQIDQRDMEIAKLRMELTLVSIRNTKLVIELDELKRKGAFADRVRIAFEEESG